MPVPGCPVTINISGGMSGPQVSLGGPGPVHQANSFIINHNGGRLEDIEVNVEGTLICNLIIILSTLSFLFCKLPIFQIVIDVCVYCLFVNPSHLIIYIISGRRKLLY